ncbi:ABC transporter permease [Actinomadura algeriensis]|uniref:ABC-2 type transport system permease protein n=1 Tax=Actinomadura algeriensis TaxID=1679523 RepID=A0ABR9JSF0_9ACTN|nr:ABC transporter permease [Actinomadura algeriensis]MBE1533498.1 ABC-2 type transport system permease protein [Actinomadura algeriensis]
MTALAGTPGTVRLVLRRDRFLLPLWVLVISVLPANFAATFQGLYPTAADRLGYAATSGTNPTFLAMYGPLYDTGIGGLVTQRSGFIPIALGLISALVVIRHTRVEEEAGRRELLGSTVVGRQAALAAALLVTAAANLAVAALITATTAAQGQPFAGSLALGLQMAAGGIVFAAVAGVTAQLSESAGTARGLAFAALGGAFVLRMAADTGGEGNSLAWLGWLSPLGWAQRLRPFGDERWWLLVPLVLLTLALTAAAWRLSTRRDVAAGVLPPRPGPAGASPRLNGPFGLAWRLQSRPLYGWLAGFAALGLVFGGVAGGMDDLINDNPDLQEIITDLGGATTVTDAYFAMVMNMLGLLAAGHAVSATLKLRTEESTHAEPLLATPTGRLHWASSHLLFALAGPAAGLAVGGLLAALVHDAGRLPDLLTAALAQLPAVWLIAAIALALFGLVPRLTPVSWAAVAVATLVTLVGPMLDAGQWALDLSPFTHLPKLPGGDVTPTPFIYLLALTAALTAIGLTTFRRRDLSLA